MTIYNTAPCAGSAVQEYSLDLDMYCMIYILCTVEQWKNYWL